MPFLLAAELAFHIEVFFSLLLCAKALGFSLLPWSHFFEASLHLLLLELKPGPLIGAKLPTPTPSYTAVHRAPLQGLIASPVLKSCTQAQSQVA